MPNMIAFIEQNNEITAENVQKVLEFNTLYNEFGKLFSPYQRASSTRGRYLDLLLRKYKLDNYIK